LAALLSTLSRLLRLLTGLVLLAALLTTLATLLVLLAALIVLIHLYAPWVFPPTVDNNVLRTGFRLEPLSNNQGPRPSRYAGVGLVSVTLYLERARECAALAEHMKPADKKTMLEIAEAWAGLAQAEATERTKADGKSSLPK
jgi:hypothetical protein